MKMKMNIKNGMGGSRCGRGRTDSTAQLKRYSKKARRQASAAAAADDDAAAAAADDDAADDDAADYVSSMELFDDHWRDGCDW